VRGRGQRIVRLQLDHGPHHDTHRGQCLLEWVELGEERGLDTFARLVAGPEVVAEGLDDVVGRDPDVGRFVLDHLQHGMQHSRDGAVRLVLAFVEAALAVEVTEQLVGAVEDVNDHLESIQPRLRGFPGEPGCRGGYIPPCSPWNRCFAT